MQATARRLSVVSATSCARGRLIRVVRPTQRVTRMDEATYIASVREVLDTLTDSARRQVVRCFAQIPAAARSASFDIFVDQDGEGFLDIRISLDGPDLFVLGRSISGCSEIVTTRIEAEGFAPPFPLMDTFEERAYSVHDTLTDVAARWILESLSDSIPPSDLPVSISSPEGYGSRLPIPLR